MLKKIAVILAGSGIILAGVIAAVLVLHPRIPLGGLSDPVSSLLTSLSGRQQSLSGDFYLTPGAWITLLAEDARLELRGEGDSRITAEIVSVETTVHLLSLLVGKIRMDGLTAHGVDVKLSSIGGGQGQKKQTDLFPTVLQETGVIDLADITVTVDTPKTDGQLVFELKRAEGGFSPVSPDKPWPFSASLTHKTVSIIIDGSIAGLGAKPELTAGISLVGDHLNDITSIFGYQGSENQPFVIKGTLAISADEIHVDITELQPGSTNLDVSAFIKGFGRQIPEYSVVLRGEHLDLDEIKALITPEKSGADINKTGNGEVKISRDEIIFPGTFPIRNLDLVLDVKELSLGGKNILDVRLDAFIHDGRIQEAPFTATFKNSLLTGHYSLDVGSKNPEISAQLNSSSINLGAILGELELADDVSLTIDHVKTDIRTRGNTFGKLFDNLSLTIDASGGLFEYRDPNTGGILPIRLEKSLITAVPGEKINLEMSGRIDTTPVKIELTLDDRRDEPPGTVNNAPFLLDILVADTQWRLSGEIPLPLALEGVSLHSDLKGENLSSLNELLNLELPDIGPYEVSGTFGIKPRGYSLDGLQLQLGTSSLTGDVFVDTKAIPPMVTIDLESPSIQLDDFRSLRAGSGQALTDVPDLGLKSTSPLNHEQPQEQQFLITDQVILDSYDSSVSVEVLEVLSGEDFLGSGTLKIEQRQGQFMISPLHLRLPTSTVLVDFSLEPAGATRLYSLDMVIEDLDYGIIGRRIKPDTDLWGIINLRTSLRAEASEFKDIMANASGYIDFSLQPEQLRAGIIDLWAVNLFSRLIPFVTDNESKINCFAGRFNIRDGVLNQENLLIDTSRIQIKGDLEVDFSRRWIEAYLRPIPKRPQFFSLATPIKISGNLSDVKTGVAAGGFIGTVIRLVTSYIVVPIQWIILNKLPEDGTPDCLQLIEEREQ